MKTARWLTVIVLLSEGLAFAGDRAASPLGRFLLQAGEGIYIVEPDLTCSWSYTFPPPVKQTLTQYDDMVGDACLLPSGHILYSANRYVREIDRDRKTTWEYRVEPPAEVKSCVPLPNGRVAVLHSGEQAILELEPDGSTLCSARVEVTRFNAAGEKTWSLTRTDLAPDFPLIIAAGTVVLPDQRIVVVNSDWHYPERDRNRVQLFAVDASKKVSWTLPATAFADWKKSWTEPKTGLVEHRCLIIQPIK